MELCVGAKILNPSRQPDLSTEAALVERCKRNDAEAFGKLVDLYQHRVFGFVKRMVHDAEEAADVAQETFIRAFQAFNRFDGRSSVRTWLFRIAYNLCIDRSRKLDRLPGESSLDTAFEDDEPMQIPDSRWDPQSGLLDEELRTVVEQGINTMSEKLRSVLLLHDRDDLSYDEIAEIAGVPVGTVKSRLFLARAHLQQVLNAYLRAEVQA